MDFQKLESSKPFISENGNYLNFVENFSFPPTLEFKQFLEEWLDWIEHFEEGNLFEKSFSLSILKNFRDEILNILKK